MVNVKKTYSDSNGFTLIELIVVLAVLGIIALIAIPRYLKVQEQSKIDADYGTAASIAQAAELYFINDTTSSTSPTIANLQNNNYLNQDWDGWQHFDNESKNVFIEIKLESGGTVGIYAGTDEHGEQLYPKE